jgi:hypothetical protein
LKDKQEALSKLLENMAMFGAVETAKGQNEIENQNMEQRNEEEVEKKDVERRTMANKFLEEILAGLPAPPQNAPQNASQSGGNMVQQNQQNMGQM